MQLISKFNKIIRFFLCVFDIFSKYPWITPLKDKKGITITNAFQKILDESNLKRNKICVDKVSEFYNRSVKSFLQNNNIEMCSTYNEGKSVIAQRLIRTLKSKIYKYMTSILKNMYVDQLDDIVNKYNSTYHKTIKWNLRMYKQTHTLTLVKKLMMKILHLKLAIMSEYQNI